LGNPKLIFVYNANSGAVNSVLDSAHKLLSPQTYQCSLCELTFRALSEKPAWKKFRTASAIEMVFLHKDEFLRQYRSKWLPKYNFPIILSEENNELHIFMDAENLDTVDGVSELITEIEKRLIN
tara:strand:- start:45116 stop:45487 length:372 start_codon:yes stop_codon:yes gene_type:complete